MKEDYLNLFKVTAGNGSCQIITCKKEAQFTIRVFNYPFHLCPEHMEQFIDQVKNEYKKVQKYNKVIEKKKKEIFEEKE